MKLERFPNNPIIKPRVKGKIESNINGASLENVLTSNIIWRSPTGVRNVESEEVLMMD